MSKKLYPNTQIERKLLLKQPKSSFKNLKNRVELLKILERDGEKTAPLSHDYFLWELEE